MGARSASRFGAVLVVCAGWLVLAGGVLAAVTPGWECIPTAAGHPVVSGGTGTAPSCGSGTAVLAPTYVSSGVGGKPTVQFAAVNVQIVNGAGSTASMNGAGNLVVGYDENPAALKQTGSHDLIVGRNHSFTGFAQLVGGFQNTATGNYSAVLGSSNTASGPDATVTGGQNNRAKGTAASVTGGYANTATSSYSDVLGGCANTAGGPGVTIVTGICADTTGHPSSFAVVTGGMAGQATTIWSSVTGGAFNTASGQSSSVTGGAANVASASKSAILGGSGQTVSSPCQTVPATNTC